MMEKRYFAGIELEKRKEFNAILKELENRNDIYVVSLPKQCEIVEMEYINNYNSDRKPTGKTFIGYDHCYVTFLYRGKMIYIQSSEYYPFTDVNYPGQWVYNIYNIVGLNKRKQSSYYREYNGLDSVNISSHHIKDTPKQYINLSMNNYMEDIKNIVAKYGGYREKEIVNAAIIVKGDTWSDEHKVLNILSVNMENDGYLPGFSVDLVTKSICGLEL